jgi:hypothetical protein
VAGILFSPGGTVFKSPNKYHIMTTEEITRILEKSMQERKKISINYKNGESHFGWITEPNDTLNTTIVLMIDGVTPHTVDLGNVESIELTNEYF